MVVVEVVVVDVVDVVDVVVVVVRGCGGQRSSRGTGERRILV